MKEVDRMRVCPKCGYVDPPYWRHSTFSAWIDLTEFESFKDLHPELAERLEKGEKIVEDEHYYYRRTKNLKRVHRKAKIDFMGAWVQPQEHAKGHDNTKKLRNLIDFRPYWKIDPNQKKLFTFSLEK